MEERPLAKPKVKLHQCDDRLCGGGVFVSKSNFSLAAIRLRAALRIKPLTVRRSDCGPHVESVRLPLQCIARTEHPSSSLSQACAVRCENKSQGWQRSCQ